MTASTRQRHFAEYNEAILGELLMASRRAEVSAYAARIVFNAVGNSSPSIRCDELRAALTDEWQSSVDLAIVMNISTDSVRRRALMLADLGAIEIRARDPRAKPALFRHMYRRVQE